jgi:uncharacterized protein YeaO (DUF488 family)
MVKETYFGALKEVKEKNKDAIFIIVSRSKPPKLQRELYDYWYRALAPNQSLFHDYKNGSCTWDEYIVRFTEQMKSSKIAQERMKKIKELDKTNDVFLICWEASDKNCHRYLLIDMINKLIS